jgi:hypothetical protein
MLQRFNKNHWWAVTASPLKNLDNVSSSGSDAEIIASSHRGVLCGELEFKLAKIFLTIPGICKSMGKTLKNCSKKLQETTISNQSQVTKEQECKMT